MRLPASPEDSTDFVKAGIASTDLIANPAAWVNRRVETIELLAHEETRRRVSVDFTLPAEAIEQLKTPQGVLVPLSVLTKEARRNFDLRDESGRAVPVLGRRENAPLAQLAVMSAAMDAFDVLPSDDALDLLASELGQIVSSDPVEAEFALSTFVGSAEQEGSIRSVVWGDPTCRRLLDILWQHYVLFAVLPEGGPARRILKYSYGEEFALSATRDRLRDRFAPGELIRRVWQPDCRRFSIECPGAERAASFHVEIAIPEELQIRRAVLIDFSSGQRVSEFDHHVNRAALYATEAIEQYADIVAYVEVVPERTGRPIHSAATSVVVALLLWAGVLSGLDAKNPGAAVSILLAGAALYSGLTASGGTHKLVAVIFNGPQRWLALTTLAALVGSGSLALEYPSQAPTGVWTIAAGVASLAGVRLLWSAIRSPT